MQMWGFICTLGADSPTRTDTIGTDECSLVCVGIADVGDAAAGLHRLFG